MKVIIFSKYQSPPLKIIYILNMLMVAAKKFCMCFHKNKQFLLVFLPFSKELFYKIFINVFTMYNWTQLSNFLVLKDCFKGHCTKNKIININVNQYTSSSYFSA